MRRVAHRTWCLIHVKVVRRVLSEVDRMTTGDIDAFCRPGAIQFAVATLESWESLCAVLDDLKAEGVEVKVSVMLAVETRADIEARLATTRALAALLDQGVELRFSGSPAHLLHRRQARGCARLASGRRRPQPRRCAHRLADPRPGGRAATPGRPGKTGGLA